MKKLFFLLSVVLFLSACGNKKEVPNLFTKEILANQLFYLNTDKDTLLRTLHGSLINIKAGSFSVTGNVQIEIREAFTSSEMLAAGLSTESNGRPLRSSGMIYLSASANGEMIELIKPIKISIPNDYYDTSMKVFTGVKTDSSINWDIPKPIDTTPQIKSWQIGKKLFEANCSNCHSIFQNGTGPALIGVEQRIPDKNIMYDYIRNPPALTTQYPYFQCLRAKFGSIMISFPNLEDTAISSILDYIKNEVAKNSINQSSAQVEAASISSAHDFDTASTKGLNLFNNNTGCDWNNCGIDTFFLPIPISSQSFFSNQTPQTSNTNSSPQENEYSENGYKNINPDQGFYEFEIKTFGWYNIDAYFEFENQVTTVKILTRLQFQFEADMHVYFVAPKRKIIQQSYYHKGNDYIFKEVDGTLPAVIGDSAFIMAYGSYKDKSYYGISAFTITAQQVISVAIKETTPEKIIKAIKESNLDGVDLGTQKREEKIVTRICNGQQSKTDSTKKAAPVPK